MPEQDDDGRETESDDTPGMVFLAACMVELGEVVRCRETRMSDKKKAHMDPNAISFRELKVSADLRVSEDGLEVLPPGSQVSRLGFGVWVLGFWRMGLRCFCLVRTWA